MDNKIKNSLDWSDIEYSLLRKSRNLENRYDIQRMILNIRASVTKLSIAEVDARRGRHQKATTLLATINQDIDMVCDYLLMASLLG